MGELCRLCALQKPNLVGIYDDEGHRLCILSKVKKCLNIELTDKGNLPKSVCLECCTKLDAFDEFLENSLNAQNTLCMLFPEIDKNDDMNNSSGLEADYKELVISEEDEFEDLDDKEDNLLPESIYTEEDKLKEVLEFDDSHLNASEQKKEMTVRYCTEKSSSRTKQSSRNKSSSSGKSENEETTDTELDNVFKSSEWDPKNWLCSDCSEEFQNVEDLRLHHTNEHKQEVRYMCSLCSKQFLLYTGFISHLKRHKNGLKYNCDECGKGFANKKILDSHRTTHSDVRPFVCEECGKAFRQQSALYIHSRCHLPEDIKNKYQCDQCNKRFSTKPNLVTHKRIHTGVRNFTCDQCGKSFIQKGNLDAHLLTHSHDKPFSCELCNKRFKTGMQLRKHHSVHTGAKPHQCDVCGRTFREKGTLREHHRIHTGAMPFTCEYCGKAFRFKGILTTHRRQHTGERPYSCVECQHHFTNWPNYNKHMKRRHGINTSRSTRSSQQECPSTTAGASTVSLYQEEETPGLDLYPTGLTPTPATSSPTPPQIPQSYIPYTIPFSLSQVAAAIDAAPNLDIMHSV